ncbi:MAG: hypothetical protein PHT71_05235, partial [Victivallaceae bacterium]|nr:hypothetical protein [Victivallaceae bacterium]
DRFYRAADKLLACRDTLETYLREREHELFNLNRTIVLYDLTKDSNGVRYYSSNGVRYYKYLFITLIFNKV